MPFRRTLGLGFRGFRALGLEGLGFRVKGFRLWELLYRVLCSYGGLKRSNSGYMEVIGFTYGLGFRVWGLDFRV